MSLGFIHRQYAAHLFVKPHIHAAQPLGNVLMYGGFTHAELLCGTAHSSFDVVGLKAEVISQPITETLEQNYMPYAMSVIVSRAIPEIDGFKPSHRKLLYTMYKMNLLSGGRTKSANIVGQTMRLNPHGDAAIYETMVRLSTFPARWFLYCL